jgi:hypothetical protein
MLDLQGLHNRWNLVPRRNLEGHTHSPPLRRGILER